MSRTLQGKKVLTVDDSATVRALVRSILERQGAQVEEADSGKSAVALYGVAANYDLILLDLILPDTDGISLLQQIRQENQESTIVMLTGVGGVKSALASVQSGADGYIEKEEVSYAGEQEEFCFRLEQAIKRREGLRAQRELERLKSDFYAMVTHDLRSPAATMSLAMELLQDELRGNTSPQVDEMMDTVHTALERMVRLIDDYLDYSAIDAGYLTLAREKVDLAEILRSASNVARMQAIAKGQRFTCEVVSTGLFVWVDGQRLKQVFDNLIVNAIKYTPESGTVAVRLYRDADDVVFQVQDSGFGMTPEQIEVLFDMYQRGQSKDARKIRGTGLGLPIVKEIVNAHGGTVLAQSPGPDRGSTFTVVIPVAEEAQSSLGERIHSEVTTHA